MSTSICKAWQNGFKRPSQLHIRPWITKLRRQRISMQRQRQKGTQSQCSPNSNAHICTIKDLARMKIVVGYSASWSCEWELGVDEQRSKRRDRQKWQYTTTWRICLRIYQLRLQMTNPRCATNWTKKKRSAGKQRKRADVQKRSQWKQTETN